MSTIEVERWRIDDVKLGLACLAWFGLNYTNVSYITLYSSFVFIVPYFVSVPHRYLFTLETASTNSF
jgi:hypothetical protein